RLQRPAPSWDNTPLGPLPYFDIGLLLLSQGGQNRSQAIFQAQALLYLGAFDERLSLALASDTFH
ncbi:hypothetical protein GGI00_006391, partial [Coemansia sp. RSA 2681]